MWRVSTPVRPSPARERLLASASRTFYAEGIRGIGVDRIVTEAGVPVESQVLAGHVHPSFAFTRLIPSAKAYERQAIAALAHALHT